MLVEETTTPTTTLNTNINPYRKAIKQRRRLVLLVASALLLDRHTVGVVLVCRVVVGVGVGRGSVARGVGVVN